MEAKVQNKKKNETKSKLCFYQRYIHRINQHTQTSNYVSKDQQPVKEHKVKVKTRADMNLMNIIQTLIRRYNTITYGKLPINYYDGNYPQTS